MSIDWTLLLVQTVLFFLPAYIANLFPVLFSKIKLFRQLFAIPIDGGKMLGKLRIFGKNKTVGGFIFGTLGGVFGIIVVLVFLVLIAAYVFSSRFVIPNEGGFILQLYLGFLMGFGAMAGDLMKSFVKRRLGIAEGKSWWIFDQDDFVVGAWLFSGLLVPYSSTWPLFLVALLITPPLHLFANVFAYKVKLKKVWW